MKSLHLTSLSAALLLVNGLALLFVPDYLLPMLIDGYPRAGAWLGQLTGAGFLAVASLNWMTRRTVVGGIFGRPTLNANVTLYFISFLALTKAASASGWPTSITTATVVAGVMAAAYGWLMFNGPLEADTTQTRA